MSRQYRVMCGTPKEHCNGSRLVTDQTFQSNKCHRSHEEAFRCHARYLVRVLGYTQIGSRDFQAPNGGPVRVLSKKIRFGSKLRLGKEGSRFMPEDREAGNRGTIIG